MFEDMQEEIIMDDPVGEVHSMIDELTGDIRDSRKELSDGILTIQETCTKISNNIESINLLVKQEYDLLVTKFLKNVVKLVAFIVIASIILVVVLV